MPTGTIKCCYHLRPWERECAEAMPRFRSDLPHIFRIPRAKPERRARNIVRVAAWILIIYLVAQSETIFRISRGEMRHEKNRFVFRNMLPGDSFRLVRRGWRGWSSSAQRHSASDTSCGLGTLQGRHGNGRAASRLYHLPSRGFVCIGRRSLADRSVG
jgi:hypothetical protein